MAQSSQECRSLPDPPTDGITSLQYIRSTSNSLLSSTSWDGCLRIHDTSSMSHQCSHAMESGPLLDACSGGDGAGSIFTGGLDGSIKRFDIETSMVSLVGQHALETAQDQDKVACSCLAPVSFSSSELSSSSTPVLASAGWDSFFYLWDVRAGNSTSQNRPIAQIKLPDKAFSMDVDPSPSSFGRLVVSTAKRRTCIIDVRKTSAIASTDGDNNEYKAEVVLDRESSLKYQTRVSRFFPNGSGIAVGSIEGRVAIEFLDELGVNSNGKKKYAFKCHRVGDVVYPVNAIAFHPKYGTFATGGCDGTVVTWDGLNKKKIFTLPKFETSIAALAFNHDGSELAIASSYTFEEGEKEHTKDEIFIRSMSDSECRPKGMK